MTKIKMLLILNQKLLSQLFIILDRNDRLLMILLFILNQFVISDNIISYSDEWSLPFIQLLRIYKKCFGV